MPAVDQPIQVAAPPLRDEGDADLEDARDRSHRVDRLRANLPAFDSRHRGLRDAGPLGHVRLSPPSALANLTKDRSEPEVVHPPEDASTPLSATHLAVRELLERLVDPEDVPRWVREGEPPSARILV